MEAPLFVFAFVVLCPAVVVLSYPILATAVVRRGRRPPATTRAEAVSVIVPCRGALEDTAAALSSILAQETSSSTEVIFCVEGPTDAVVPIVEALLREKPHRGRLVWTGDPGDDLGKLHNLIAGVDASTSECIVFVDSDVRFDHPRALKALVADLDRPGVGLVSGFPAYRGARNLPAAQLTMTINNDLLGCFAAVACSRSLAVANGSCLAIRRSVLEATGGVRGLRDRLLMDTTLARRVARLGYRVHLHHHPVPVVRHRASWRECWQQPLRWQVSMRHALPARHYVGFLWLRTAAILCVAGLFAFEFSPGARIVAGAYFAARVCSAWLMDALYLRSGTFRRCVWMIPAADVFNGVTAVTALYSNTIEWGGRRYRVHKGGYVTRVRDPQGDPSARRGAQPVS